MTTKGRAPGAAPSGEPPAGPAPKDLLSALDDAPAEMEAPTEEDDGNEPLDAEQIDNAKAFGMDSAQASALRRFIQSVR